jgi:YHS domain-containing protein
MGKGAKQAPAPAATSQTVTNTSIPEYARPYVESMLGKSEALTDINQNPYQNYGGQRIAEFNPTQQNAFQEAINRQSASQMAPATGLAAASGMGSLGIAGQMAGAGQQYANQATNPFAQQAYMSPYIQNALQPQLEEMQRQYAITGQQEQGRATGAGAFGGTRQALMQAENQRNKNMAMNQAIGSGYQDAFKAAQQAQQFGANLGLQGYQGALSGLGQAGQAASTLGQLGQTQFGQESALNAERQKIGALQQAQAQQGLDLSYQDFLKQRNYPYQQLAFQSDMLRGLPLSQSAKSLYEAPPSMGSQLGGLGMTALGIYGQSGGFKANGGMVGKGYAQGGQIGYATGGDIKMMKTEQLEQLLENPGLTPLESDMVEKELMIRRRMEMNPESDQIMAPAMRAGIGSIATGDMVPEQMAGGGIVAFSQGGNKGVESIKDASQARQSYRDQLEREVLDSMKRLKTEDPFKESRAQDEQIRAQIAESKRASPYEALTMAGLRTMAGTSPYALTNLGAGGEEGVKTLARTKREESDLQKQLLQQGVEREKSMFGRQSQLLGAQQTALGQLYGKEADIERTRFAKAQLDQGKDTQNLIAAQRVFDNALKAEKTNLFQQNKARFNMDYTSPELDAEATKNVMSRLTPGIKNMLFPDGLINPAAAAVPAPVDPSTKPKSKADEKTQFKVTLDGKTFGFPTQKALDDFKKLAGVK